MESGKNLHASIPAALLMEAEKAASAERRRQLLYSYGEGQAHHLGIKEEEVDRLIHVFRQEEQDGLKNGNGR